MFEKKHLVQIPIIILLKHQQKNTRVLALVEFLREWENNYKETVQSVELCSI